MERKNLGMILGLVLSNVASLSGGVALGSAFPDVIRQRSDRAVYNRYRPAPGFHEDPWNLDINYHINKDGQLESYLVDRVKGRGTPIGEDAYPPTNEMCRKLIEKGIISATDVSIPDMIVESAVYSTTAGLVKKLW